MSPVILQSTITCPHCGLQKEETMPTDACQYFYACTGCGTVLKPKPVYCSYSSSVRTSSNGHKVIKCK